MMMLNVALSPLHFHTWSVAELRGYFPNSLCCPDPPLPDWHSHFPSVRQNGPIISPVSADMLDVLCHLVAGWNIHAVK